MMKPRTMGMPAPSFRLVKMRAKDPMNCKKLVMKLACPVFPCIMRHLVQHTQEQEAIGQFHTHAIAWKRSQMW